MSSKAIEVGEEKPASPAPAKPRLERILLITVVVLGFLIVAGLGAVLFRIVYLASAPPSQFAAQEANDASRASSELPFEAQLSLPEDAVVRSTSIAANRLAVHYETPNGTGIAIVDLVTGRTLGRLRTPPKEPAH